MVREVGIGAGDRLAARKVFVLEGVSIGCQNEFCLRPRSPRVGLERGKPLRDLAGSGDADMDVVGLEDAAQVRLVRLALSQACDCRLLVAEGLKEGEGKLGRIERLLGES